MSSPQSIDEAKIERQIEEDIRARSQEKHDGAIREGLEKKQAAVAPFDGEIPLTDGEAAKGRAISRSTFLLRLRELNPQLYPERSVQNPAQGGLYLRDWVSNPNHPDLRYRGVRFVLGFPWDHISEHDQALTYEKDGRLESMGKVPGWRSIGVRLIKAGLIEQAAFERVFKIPQGRSSARYQAVLA